VPYLTMLELLMEFLINIKKVDFKGLIDQHFSLPIDRISRFLNMIKDELDIKHSKNSEVKEFFLEEIKFTH